MMAQETLLKYISRASTVLIVALILAVNAARFIGLENSPPGFHVDEIASAVTVQCLVTEGKDALGAPYPLFSDLKFGTPKPPTQLYFGMLWSKLFGFSIQSFRAMSAFGALMGIIGLFFLSRCFLGSRYALLVALSASISPWAWMFSRIAYESIVGPSFIVWGLYFCLRSDRARDFILAGIFVSAAMYSYPPMRAQVPLMLFPLFLYKCAAQKTRLMKMAPFLFSLVVVSVPLVWLTLNGTLQSRFSKIGIFSEQYFLSIGKTKTALNILSLFIHNYLSHFGFNYLFVSGDANIVHSSQIVGELSWLDAAGLFLVICLVLCRLLIKRKTGKLMNQSEKFMAFFIAVNILIGIVPSALTWEGMPHALRSIGAMPFTAMLCGYMIWKVTEEWKMAYPLIAAIAIMFSVYFLKYYFLKYPKEAYGMFATYAKDRAKQAETANDWNQFIYVHQNQNYTLMYYLLNYHRKGTCTSIREGWENFRKNRGS